jgi:hypothetical protein
MEPILLLSFFSMKKNFSSGSSLSYLFKLFLGLLRVKRLIPTSDFWIIEPVKKQRQILFLHNPQIHISAFKQLNSPSTDFTLWICGRGVNIVLSICLADFSFQLSKEIARGSNPRCISRFCPLSNPESSRLFQVYSLFRNPPCSELTRLQIRWLSILLEKSSFPCPY